MAETGDHHAPHVSTGEEPNSSAGGSPPPSPGSGMGQRRPTVRNLGALSISLQAAWTGVPRDDADGAGQPTPRTGSSSAWSSPTPRVPHFLDECRLCTRPLGRFFDIYMYQGDTPFCSEECRDEHIQFEEVKERSRARFAAAREEGEEQARMERVVVRAEAGVAVEVV